MLEFPIIPIWWKTGFKFMKLMKGFNAPNWIVGYDTETYLGSIMTQQFYWTKYGSKTRQSRITWESDDTVLDNFLNFCGSMPGFIVLYCFNAKFDLAILMREYIDKFLQDDFTVRHQTNKGNTWEITVCCSKNWYAFFRSGNTFIYFLDLQNFFSGSLAKMAKDLNLETMKVERPEGLGERKFLKTDKKFCEYALSDSLICLEAAERLMLMHEEFDIPVATSSANFSEKVFRRDFIPEGKKYIFPDNFECLRLAELSYHGGKNGYYLDNPAFVRNCYEYDFNSAYPFAMYNIPSFIAGKYEKVDRFTEGFVGIYQAIGKLNPCKFGVLYNSEFNYFRYSEPLDVRVFVNSYELQEAINSGEFKLQEVKGYIWKPETTESPLKEYSRYFWEKKNATPKSDLRYQFYKLLLNSLYGKWIQRNPVKRAKYVYSSGQLELFKKQQQAGGLYHPFIASLITGNTRARLHQAEHRFNAIESSTDSVKTKKFDKKAANIKEMGVMQLEHFFCKDCNKEYPKANGLFVRNRLNLLLCPQEHVMKCALHGFWGKPQELLKMYKNQEYVYEVERMPLIREGIKQIKDLFQLGVEERSLQNISWDNCKVI